MFALFGGKYQYLRAGTPLAIVLAHGKRFSLPATSRRRDLGECVREAPPRELLRSGEPRRELTRGEGTSEGLLVELKILRRIIRAIDINSVMTNSVQADAL